MQAKVLVRRPWPARVVAVMVAAAVLATVALVQLVTIQPASAHGTTINPMSRNYSCWKRWGNDFQNPAMATQDPMCWQAWQANPNAMWNWNGLYKEQVFGNHQAHVPDGTLCSGGNAEGGRYNAMDTVGNWTATSLANNFTLVVHDQALHGADYFRVYVSRQGFNPITTKPRWADLELRADTGLIPPRVGQTTTDPVLNGVSINIPVTAPNRTGRHLVFVVWKASHADQNYYWCSDVNFPGGTPNPTPTATPTANPTTQPPTTPPTTQPPTTNPPTGTPGSCSATYTILNSWSGGFQAEVRVTAGSSAIRSWRVAWTFANGQTIGNAWSAVVTSSGSSIVATNVNYNGTLSAGGSTTFGFLGSVSGTNSLPTLSCTATV